MNPLNPTDRKRGNPARIGVESLETRELMTAGMGNAFAIVPGTIAKAGATVSIPFTIDPAHFTLPRGKMIVGIDVAPSPSSGLKPVISSVTDPQGHPVAQMQHASYNPHVAHAPGASAQATSAVLTPVSFYPHNPTKPATYTVNVTAGQNTTGNFLIEFYLPGDAKGAGKVDQSSVQAVKTALRTTSTSANYNFNADANRDNRIGVTDLSIARQNLGVATTISPIVSANLDPASDTGLADRITKLRNIHFSGTATPGATVSYTETATPPTGPASTSITNRTPQTFGTTADSSGNYDLRIMLGDGANYFHVSTHDAFGQSIAGDIAPVTYSATAPESLIASITTDTTPKKT